MAYRHGQPFAVVVLGMRDESIGRISLFGDPTVIQRFLEWQEPAQVDVTDLARKR